MLCDFIKQIIFSYENRAGGYYFVDKKLKLNYLRYNIYVMVNISFPI